MAATDPRTQAFRDWIGAICTRLDISPTELARRAGMAPSTMTRAMNNANYKINFRLSTISKLADIGGISPPSIIQAGGDDARSEGFSEPEAALFNGPAERPLTPNQTIWTVQTTALQSMGLMAGDRFVLDMGVAPKTRDIVVVQVYDHQTGTAETLLRVFADGFAVTPLYLVEGSKRLWIDGTNVAIMGTVIESWRTRAA